MFSFPDRPYPIADEPIWTNNPVDYSQQQWMVQNVVTVPQFEDGILRMAGSVGLGDASSAIGASSSIATGAISIPAIQGALGISAAAAGFATLGISAAAMGVIAWLNRRGPKQKVATTQIVNEAEPILQANLAQFQQGPKTHEAKEYHLAVFNKVWEAVVASCSDPSLGNPGKACIADRSRGGKWDWASYYYDPIASTPTIPQIEQTKQDITATLSANLGGNWQVLLGGGLLLVGLVSFFGEGKK